MTATYSGGRLTLSAPPPAALAPAVRVLKTGLAALASGRAWYGCESATGHSRRVSPDEPVPAGVTLLTVEGAAKWDRVPSAARLDLPELFADAEPTDTRRPTPRRSAA